MHEFLRFVVGSFMVAAFIFVTVWLTFAIFSAVVQ